MKKREVMENKKEQVKSKIEKINVNEVKLLDFNN